MADLCKQCSIDIYGKDFGDLKGLGKGEELQKGNGWSCLCEGCGHTVVDDEGSCVSYFCELHGEENRKKGV